ncbi:hypothetical protein [Mycetocola miduiensis]|uniref:SnoaL-like domain-containing protein n=1 Tax=Mycetocola miduiensis TaxID=995034 RepID=A0A1I5E2G6_9MICO|nr:hypothetical protein [Mycetocola miduiensis]SFO05480.1 hypothetical protein SAMN05216219_3234 [Mycetocola miduiensis]
MAKNRSTTTPRMLRSIVGIFGCLLGSVMLGGCTPAPPATPTPTSTAIFASEDEALAAATDVFTAYLAAYDSAMADGGRDLATVREYVSDDYFAEVSEPGTIVTNGWHTSGVSTFEVKEVPHFDASNNSANIHLNICRDITGIRVLDMNDHDVTPPDREMRVPLAVSFAVATDDEWNGALRIVDVESWLDADAC